MSFKLAFVNFFKQSITWFTGKMSQSVREIPSPRLHPINNKLPLVVILGATGTGKSKLAIDLALRFNGEVISADSMQVYKGLDILTNKVTKSEAKGVPHHMISVVGPLTKFDVKNFRNTALPIVEKLLEEQKLPIIVGGTNYYIESLIWEILIDKEHVKKESQQVKRLKLNDYDENDPKLSKAKELLTLFEKHSSIAEYPDVSAWTNSEVYEALKVIDPRRASKLHPNDRRKSLRSIQIFFQTGRTHSDLILEQLQQNHGTGSVSATDSDSDNGSNKTKTNKTTCNSNTKDNISSCTNNDSNSIPPVTSLTPLGGSLRFQNVVCLWIQAPMDILTKRIHKRVDEMIEKGLREELDSYMDFIGLDTTMVFTEGLLQSIGFKEFEDYLRLGPDDKSSSKKGDKIFMEGVDRLKIVTRQYARKQLKWIKNRFLCPSRREVPPVFWLDGSNTDDSSWENNVTVVSKQIVSCYLSNQLDHQLLRERRVPETVDTVQDDLQARVCDVCDRTLIGNVQWQLHLKSYKHKKALQKKSKTDQDSDKYQMNQNNNNNNDDGDDGKDKKEEGKHGDEMEEKMECTVKT